MPGHPIAPQVSPTANPNLTTPPSLQRDGTVVNDILDARVPVIYGLHVVPGKEIGHRMRILHTAELVDLPVAHTEDEVAGAVGVGDAADRVLERVVKLQNVTQNELDRGGRRGE